MLIVLIKLLALMPSMQNRAHRNYLFLLYFTIHYVRDVGAAGSNPVTPTIKTGVRSGHMTADARWGRVLAPAGASFRHVLRFESAVVGLADVAARGLAAASTGVRPSANIC